MAKVEFEAATREATVATLEPERPAATTLLEEVSEWAASASSRTRTTAGIVRVVAVIKPSTELRIGEDFVRLVDCRHLGLRPSFVGVSSLNGFAASSPLVSAREPRVKHDILGLLDSSLIRIARYAQDLVVILLLAQFEQPLRLAQTCVNLTQTQ